MKMGYQYIEILYIGKNFYEKKMQRLEFVNVKLFDSLMKVICDLCIYRKVNVFDYGVWFFGDMFIVVDVVLG